jgi:uncharacterized protein (TIGR03437 family)
VAGGAPATVASPDAIARDAAGNLYFCGDTMISRVAPGGGITAFAGTGTPGYSGDGGAAIAAQFNGISSCAIDPKGNLIVADFFNNRVRRIDSAGIVTTIAGTGVSGQLGNQGQGTDAQSGWVESVAVDTSGNVYFSDFTFGTIRELTTAGVVIPVAGAPNSERFVASGDGGPAISASIASPGPMAIDGSGNIYIVDGTLVRRIAKDGIITTVAGAQSTSISVKDGALATSGSLPYLSALAADAAGDLFLGAGAFIRRVDGQTGIITTIAGNSNVSAPLEGSALSVFLGTPHGFYLDSSGVLWFSTGQIQTLSNGMVTTIVHGGSLAGPPDGAVATAVSLLDPLSIAVSAAGDLYFGEGIGCHIRKVGSDGKLRTVAGTGTCNSQTGIVPYSIVVDSAGNIYSSDAQNATFSKVYKITPSGSVSVVAGFLGGRLAIDSQDRVYEVERGSAKVLVLSPGGSVQTLINSITLPRTGVSASGPLLASQAAIAVGPDGNLYVVASSNPTVSLGISYLYVYGSNSQVTSVTPISAWAATRLAMDGSGNAWVADYESSLWAVGSQLSYQQYFSGRNDGPLLSAGFGNVFDLTSGPDGSIYVLDTGCYCVRKISGRPPAKAPAISAAGVVNAASLAAGPVTGGELISIFGSNLGAAGIESYTLANGSVPNVLDDIEVLVNNYPAPITAVSPGQINVFVPYGAYTYPPGKPTLTLEVNAHGAPSTVLTVPVAPSAFGLFTANGSGSGQGAILNQDGSYNGASNPAPAGSIVSFFGTGDGGIAPSTPAGGLVTSSPFPQIALPVSVTIGGKAANVVYAGAAPFLPGGVDQINAAIPAGIPAGPAAVVVSIGGVSSTQTVTVAVK